MAMVFVRGGLGAPQSKLTSQSSAFLRAHACMPVQFWGRWGPSYRYMVADRLTPGAYIP